MKLRSLYILALSLSLIASRIFGIFVGLLLFGIIVCIHELGHFLVGLKLGFRITEFSIFLGPTLYSFKYKGILFSIKLIPLGAYVRFYGESEDEANPDANIDKVKEEEKESEENTWLAPKDTGAFINRPASYRILTILAGPFINIFTGFLAILILFISFGYETNIIDKVSEKSLFADLGIKEGTKILSINKRAIHNSFDINYLRVLMRSQKENVKPLVIRYEDEEGKVHELEAKPKEEEMLLLGIQYQVKDIDINNEKQKALFIEGLSSTRAKENILQQGDYILEIDSKKAATLDIDSWRQAKKEANSLKANLVIYRNTKVQKLDIELEKMKSLQDLGFSLRKSNSFFRAIPAAYNYSKSIISLSVDAIGQIFTGKLRAKDSLSGSVGLISVIANASTSNEGILVKVKALLSLFATISLSLGLINLFPLPPLDGFLFLISFYELVFRRRFPEKFQYYLTILGLAILAFLFISGLYFDLGRIFF